MNTPLYNVTVENLDSGRVSTQMDCTLEQVAALQENEHYNVLLVSRCDYTLEQQLDRVLSFYRGGYID